MKKLFSFIFKLAIVVIVLLFVLNNADAIKSLISDIVGYLPMQNNEKEYVPTGTTPPWDSIHTKVPDPKVDTITEEQFEIAMNKTNFMVVTNNYFANNGFNSSFEYVTDYAMSGRDGDSFESYRVYYAKVDGDWYVLNYQDNTVLGTKLLHDMDVTVRSRAYANDITFSDLTYDASKGCYTFSTVFITEDGETSIPIHLYFNEGDLEFVEVFWPGSEESSYRMVSCISDYHGEINIPEFTIVE